MKEFIARIRNNFCMPTINKQRPRATASDVGHGLRSHLKLLCLLSQNHVSQGQGMAANGAEQQMHLSAAQGNEQPTSTAANSVASCLSTDIATTAPEHSAKASPPLPPGPEGETVGIVRQVPIGKQRGAAEYHSAKHGQPAPDSHAGGPS